VASRARLGFACQDSNPLALHPGRALYLQLDSVVDGESVLGVTAVRRRDPDDQLVHVFGDILYFVPCDLVGSDRPSMVEQLI
jgi:hypothetical protein